MAVEYHRYDEAVRVVYRYKHRQRVTNSSEHYSSILHQYAVDEQPEEIMKRIQEKAEKEAEKARKAAEAVKKAEEKAKAAQEKITKKQNKNQEQVS